MICFFFLSWVLKTDFLQVGPPRFYPPFASLFSLFLDSPHSDWIVRHISRAIWSSEIPQNIWIGGSLSSGVGRLVGCYFFIVKKIIFFVEFLFFDLRSVALSLGYKVHFFWLHIISELSHATNNIKLGTKLS